MGLYYVWSAGEIGYNDFIILHYLAVRFQDNFAFLVQIRLYSKTSGFATRGLIKTIFRILDLKEKLNFFFFWRGVVDPTILILV